MFNLCINMQQIFSYKGVLGIRKFLNPPNLSPESKTRLKWMDYYRKTKNVSLTCRHFDISRKTFYKWKKLYNPRNLVTLESRDKAPIKKRQREISSEQEMRIVDLRKQYLRYGKEKISRLYESTYKEHISCWKIQKTIEKYRLYYHPKRTEAIRRKRQRSQKKKRITQLKQKRISGFLLQIDTIVIFSNGLKRYIFTAIDKYSKIAFAKMYTTHSSYNARDFLYRLNYLLDGKIDNIQTDNGSEFLKYFDRACCKLNINHYFSRNHTPKDNAVLERFNRTLQEEFINQGNFNSDIKCFNKTMTEWLVEYNFRRPHQTLDYMSPINFQTKHLKVLPMYPSSTYS
jgi:transposase InsO family protein